MNEPMRLDEDGGRPEARSPAPNAYYFPAASYPPMPPSYSAPPEGYSPSEPATYSGVDDVVAQIAARMRALNGAPPRYPMQAPAPPPAPNYPVVGPDLSALENQLRHITAQIETLRQPVPDFGPALKALRQDLAEIGQRLMEAMPRCAIEALEIEVRRLADRIDLSRAAGVDAATIAGMERGLNEVRDALFGLKPAESLAGFEQAIRNLSDKIDRADSDYHNPASLHQLENAIAAMRAIAANVASNDMLAGLAEEVRGLAVKVERAASSAKVIDPDIMHVLEQRIASLPVLGAIERGFADLTARLDSLQVMPVIDPTPAVDHLKRDLVRTQDSLEAVHSTLGHLVDRLAMIEGGIRDVRFAPDAPPTAPAKPTPETPPDAMTAFPPPGADIRPAAADIASLVQVAASVAGQQTATALSPQYERQPSENPLPPDYPLEPGSGVPRPFGSAAERIAASEAAVSAVKGGVNYSGQTNFIAAARRAAQAAAAASPESENADTPAGSIGQKMRTMFLAAGAILLIASSARVGLELLDTDTSLPVAEMSEPAEIAIAENAEQQQQQQAAAVPPASMPKEKDVVGSSPSGVIIPERPRNVSPASAPAASSDSGATGSIAMPNAIPNASEAPREAAPALSDKLPLTLRNAAIKGQPAAEYEIGVRHLEGRGIAQNTEEGLRWLERAAKSGLAPAHFRLGGLYEKGLGIKKNLDTARRHYVVAAEKGHAKAMHNLAVLHAEGVDGKPDYKAAVYWFRRAAEYGLADSQYNLGILFARGIGIEQNLPESYKWFALAALQGDRDSAKKRDDVGAKLDTASLAAARSAVQNFTAQSQPDEAVIVQAPPGGWDRPAADTTPATKKPRTSGSARVTAS